MIGGDLPCIQALHGVLSKRALRPIWIILQVLMASGCRAPEASRETEADVRPLSQGELQIQTGLITATPRGIDLTVPSKSGWKIWGGFSLKEGVGHGLGETVKVPLPLVGWARKQEKLPLVLVRLVNVTVGPGTATGLQFVAPAEYDPALQVLTIRGEVALALMDQNQPAQDGLYLVIGASGPIAILSGRVLFQPYGSGANASPVKAARVEASGSPFLSISGSKGEFAIPILAGTSGTLHAFAADHGSLGDRASVLTSAVAQYRGIGITGELMQVFIERAEGHGDVDESALPTTTEQGGWLIIHQDLYLHQVPEYAPIPKPLPPDLGPEIPNPADNKSADPEPDVDSTVFRTVDRRDPREVQRDLGCSGITDQGQKTLTMDLDLLGDFKAFRGWRGLGDVRMTNQNHEAIFGDPSDLQSPSYLDQITGYCLLTTGDGRFRRGGGQSPQLRYPAGRASRSAQLWQRVKVPGKDSGVRSLRVRMSLFTQELPRYLDFYASDGYFVRFDESPFFLAVGSVQSLADTNPMSCYVEGVPALPCGAWRKAHDLADVSGALWDIDQSREAATYDAGCPQEGSPCYHARTSPMELCANLSSHEKGQTLTLRIGVLDGGDALFDTALAIDSIAFSKESCPF